MPSSSIDEKTSRRAQGRKADVRCATDAEKLSLQSGHWERQRPDIGRSIHALKSERSNGTLFVPIHLVGDLQIDEAGYHHFNVDKKNSCLCSLGKTLTSFGNEKFCMECCDKLTALQAWPFSKISVEQWLSNFEDVDKPFALHMVSQFIYLNDQMIDAQFLSSFQSLSNIICSDWEPFDETRKKWNSFLNTCLIVPVQGEIPNPSDSGYTFARKARQILGIAEEQLVDLDEAIASVVAGKNLPLVFVDDFVGSGEQFTKTLKRRSRRVGLAGMSIENLWPSNPNLTVFYCNVTMTQKGMERINDDFPGVALASGNVLGREYSWVSKESGMWPDEKRDDGIAMIEKYSKNLGYIDDDGSESDWRGFHCLGLGIAFEHSTPDATLPLFFSDENGWKPLVSRR